jgi:aspartyl-tRNA(Asn)/glutamyl-tRNA(Gln) amidotransferase subunit B
MFGGIVMNYFVTIGIEIHCELKTNTKMFSGAPVRFGEVANTCTSVVDLGHPGCLPCVNKEAVALAIKACTAMHCDLETLVRFDRKNYYYSDLPKGFQITQQFHPIGTNGYVEIDVDGEKKQIRIERIHMEEDTAKQFGFRKRKSRQNHKNCYEELKLYQNQICIVQKRQLLMWKHFVKIFYI